MIKHKFTRSFSSSSDLKEVIIIIPLTYIVNPCTTLGGLSSSDPSHCDKWLVVNLYQINNIKQYKQYKHFKCLAQAPDVIN